MYKVAGVVGVLLRSGQDDPSDTDLPISAAAIEPHTHIYPHCQCCLGGTAKIFDIYNQWQTIDSFLH